MMNETLYVVDEIVARPGRARAFLEAYMERYAPGASARGLVLERVLVSPPMWLDDQSNTLIITWTLQGGAPAWWQMSFQARSDAAVTQWWAEADEMAMSRKRSYMSAVADVEVLCHV